MRFEFGTVFSRFFDLAGQTLPVLLAITLLGYVLPDVAFTWVMERYLGAAPDFDTARIMSPGNLHWALLGGGGLVNLGLYMINCAMVSEVAILKGAGKPVNVLSVLKSAVINAVPILIISILTGLWIAAGFIALIVPGVILSLGLSVVIPVFVGERHLGIFGAMKRSLDLTRHHRGTIFLIQLVFGVVYAILTMGIGQAAVSVVSHYSDFPGLDLIVLGLSDLLSLPLSLLTAVIYVCLRLSKDRKAPDSAAAVFE